jgi:hypothetical protein
MIEGALAQSPLVLVLYEELAVGVDDVWSVMESIRDRADLRFDDRSVSSLDLS